MFILNTSPNDGQKNKYAIQNKMAKSVRLVFQFVCLCVKNSGASHFF